jgi:hypothetical protein
MMDVGVVQAVLIFRAGLAAFLYRDLRVVVVHAAS